MTDIPPLAGNPVKWPANVQWRQLPDNIAFDPTGRDTPTEEVEVEELIGASLRYALATALGLKFQVYTPTYGLGYRISCQGMSEFYRPDVDWLQGGPLVETHWREATAWLQDHLGPDWKDQIGSSRGALLRWLCRGIVGSRVGKTIMIPEYLSV